MENLTTKAQARKGFIKVEAEIARLANAFGVDLEALETACQAYTDQKFNSIVNGNEEKY